MREEAKRKDPATLLMEGKIPPPDDTVAFIIRRAEELSIAGGQLAAQEKALAEKLAETRQKLVETNGALAQYRKDLNLLMLRGEAPPAPPTLVPSASEEDPQPQPEGSDDD